MIACFISAVSVGLLRGTPQPSQERSIWGRLVSNLGDGVSDVVWEKEGVLDRLRVVEVDPLALRGPASRDGAVAFVGFVDGWGACC